MNTTKYLVAVGALAASLTLTTSPALATPTDISSSPSAEATSVSIQNSEPTTYNAEAQSDGSVLVSLTNGYFNLNDGKAEIKDLSGRTREVMPEMLTDVSGQTVKVTYSINANDSLSVSKATLVSGRTAFFGWRAYGSCVAKNAAGGVVGGAAAGCLGGWLGFIPHACGAGAGIGAATTGVAAGVGSLIWCW